jgi:hypothetical protein
MGLSGIPGCLASFAAPFLEIPNVDPAPLPTMQKTVGSTGGNRCNQAISRFDHREL